MNLSNLKKNLWNITTFLTYQNKKWNGSNGGSNRITTADTIGRHETRVEMYSSWITPEVLRKMNVEMDLINKKTFEVVEQLFGYWKKRNGVSGCPVRKVARPWNITEYKGKSNQPWQRLFDIWSLTSSWSNDDNHWSTERTQRDFGEGEGSPQGQITNCAGWILCAFWGLIWLGHTVCHSLRLRRHGDGNCGARLLAIGKVCALHNFSANQQPWARKAPNEPGNF